MYLVIELSLPSSTLELLCSYTWMSLAALAVCGVNECVGV